MWYSWKELLIWLLMIVGVLLVFITFVIVAHALSDRIDLHLKEQFLKKHPESIVIIKLT